MKTVNYEIYYFDGAPVRIVVLESPFDQPQDSRFLVKTVNYKIYYFDGALVRRVVLESPFDQPQDSRFLVKTVNYEIYYFDGAPVRIVIRIAFRSISRYPFPNRNPIFLLQTSRTRV